LGTGIKEKILDDIGLVAEAEHEIGMPVVAIPLHDMAHDRLMSERDHRFRHGFGIFADAGSKTTAEENDLRDAISFGSIIVTVGIGVTNFAPHDATCRICLTISSFRFQGRMRM